MLGDKSEDYAEGTSTVCQNRVGVYFYKKLLCSYLACEEN